MDREGGDRENPSLGNPKYKALYDRKEQIQNKIDGLQLKAKDLLEKVNKYKDEHKNNVVYTYIQFHSMNGKQKFMDSLNRSKLSCKHRCMLSCGCQRRVKELEHKLIGGMYPEVADAPDPTLILWSNLGVGKVNRCCRASANYLFSVLIIAIGFVIIIYIGNLRDKRVDSSWSPTACGSDQSRYYL